MPGFLVHESVVILGGARTPFGAFNGTLSGVSATELAIWASRGALERSGVKGEHLDHVIFGNVIPSSPDAAYLARHVGLKLDLDQQVPALTLNRLCGSGFESVTQATDLILLGRARTVLAGGTENMSQAPFQLWGARKGIGLGQQRMGDALWDGLRDSAIDQPMGVTAETLAREFNISRESCDAFALASQERAASAQARGIFQEEIIPMQWRERSKERRLDHDEHPRQTSLEQLAKLPTVFDAQGVITAGSSSGIVDGAAAVIVAQEAWAKAQGYQPLARIKAYAVRGCDPRRMGLGPVAASREALSALGKTLSDMDVVEINEAFAPQVLACVAELGVRPDRLNVNGGAIALGHPLGASGTRLLLTLALELRRRGGRYGLATACIGGGQGIAVILESALTEGA